MFDHLVNMTSDADQLELLGRTAAAVSSAEWIPTTFGTMTTDCEHSASTDHYPNFDWNKTFDELLAFEPLKPLSPMTVGRSSSNVTDRTQNEELDVTRTLLDISTSRAIYMERPAVPRFNQLKFIHPTIILGPLDYCCDKPIGVFPPLSLIQQNGPTSHSTKQSSSKVNFCGNNANRIYGITNRIHEPIKPASLVASSIRTRPKTTLERQMNLRQRTNVEPVDAKPNFKLPVIATPLKRKSNEGLLRHVLIKRCLESPISNEIEVKNKENLPPPIVRTTLRTRRKTSVVCQMNFRRHRTLYTKKIVQPIAAKSNENPPMNVLPLQNAGQVIIGKNRSIPECMQFLQRNSITVSKIRQIPILQ